jgi:cell wall-associated NlpC family hydrolase
MTKKLVVMLLCLSLPIFAHKPIRHRVALSEPDMSVRPLTVQKGLEEISSPLSPLCQINRASERNSPIASDLIQQAKQLIGSRYRRGSNGPKAFDCSGFTSYVFRQMGIELKRSSREQGTMGELVASVGELLPGDLVFFGNSGRRGSNINHVGIVTAVDSQEGTFEFIHSSTSRGVRIDRYPDANYWNSHFITGRRVLQTHIPYEK